ncbi:hypothetical protein DFQ26_007040 [Actinomortierella ambigua]|nr:hypothetical protein DFQ26_007040 [Actinomortierella ambigua]
MSTNAPQGIQQLQSYFHRRIRSFVRTVSIASVPENATLWRSEVNPLMLPEILHGVFSFLSTKTLVRVNLVCKTWHAQASGHLWRDPFFRPYSDGDHIKKRVLPFIKDHLGHVQSLNLAYARWDVMEAVARLPVAEFPAVTRLDLFCATLDDDLLIMLLAKTPHLRVLDLKQSDCLSETCIQQIQRLTHLETLSIDVDLRVWPSKIKRLKWCHASGTSTEEQVQATLQGILRCCPLLDELVLQELQLKSTSWFEQLLIQKPNLRRLSLFACELDGQVLHRVAPTSLQYLTRFDVSMCDHVRAKDVIAVLDACPHITSLFVSLVEGLELDKVSPQVLGRLEVLRLSLFDLSVASMHAILDDCWSLRRLHLNDLSVAMRALGEIKPFSWAFAETLQELSIQKVRSGDQGSSSSSSENTERFSRGILQNLSQLTHLHSLMIADSDIVFKVNISGLLAPMANLKRIRQLVLFGLANRLQFQEIQWITNSYLALEELVCYEATEIPIQSWLRLHHPEIVLSYPTNQWRTMQIKDPLSFEG